MRATFISILSAASFCSLLFPVVAQSDTPSRLARNPSVVHAPVQKVFVPVGFDDNDNAEIVVHGYFPNSCYKAGQVTAEVDATNRKITVHAKAYLYPASFCLQMILPFTESIKLGVLKPGNYDIIVEGSPNASVLPLIVEPRKSENADDYLYASATSANLVQDEATGAFNLNLSGSHPHMFVGCMIMKEVKTYLTSGNVLVVLPIAEAVDDERCLKPKWQEKFNVSVPVEKPLDGDILVHVRVLNGQSLNSFVKK